MVINGFSAILFNLVMLPALAFLNFYLLEEVVWLAVPILLVLILAFVLMLPGYFSQEPNEARVMVFFGKYEGTFKRTGFYWVNPFIAGQLVGIGCAHAVIRLYHHRVAHLVDELPAALVIVHHVVACGGDAGLLVILLHLALVLDAGHILGLEAAGDVEIGAQGGVAFQPVFVVGFQPVDAAILEGEERHGAVDLVVIFEAADLVVFVQAGLQLRLQLIIRLVADAQNVHAVVFQLPAELPVQDII